MLTRTLKFGSVGADVEAWTIGAHRYLQTRQLAAFEDQPKTMRRTFGIAKRTLAKQCAKKAGLPQYGIVGPALFGKMSKAGAFNADAKALFREYSDSKKPKLIEPLQGFDSLHKSLWPIYSAGRSLGLSDLGTYNPASRLPSGNPSDHSVYPAYALDLGVDPDNGFDNPVGRKVFDLAMKDPAVEYVILGNRIGFPSNGVIRKYTSGGHENHVHISGRR